MREVIKTVKPILHDLKDGTLKRVAPSRYVEETESTESADTDLEEEGGEEELTSISLQEQVRRSLNESECDSTNHTGP